MTDSFTIDEVVSLCKDKTLGIGPEAIVNAEREDTARVLKHCSLTTQAYT